MDIIDIAIKEIGYQEQGTNQTKYGKWFGMNGAPWCHMFVSWCANQAGISSGIVPKTASTTTGMNWFKQKGKFKYKGSYTPKRGDIIYFKTGRSHVGIVEYVKNGQVHTVEGNSGNRVKRRSYALSEKTITGYGVPSYPNGPTPTGSSSSAEKKTSKEELAYLKRILKGKNPIAETVEGEVEEVPNATNLRLSVRIKNGTRYFEVPVEDGMKVVLERCGTPGKLTFTTIYDKEFQFQEGNLVKVLINKVCFFQGFIFSKNRDKKNLIEVTAYDQLRYLKNKDIIIYKNKTATEVIKQIAAKYQLKVGTLEDTKYKMSKVEDDQTLFDIIQTALDNTLMTKGQLYIFYDDCGKLTLKNISKMKTNDCLIDKETAENYKYKTTIDEEVYNQIKLVYENKEKGSYDVYMTQDKKTIHEWGLLQYLEKIDTPDVGKLKAEALIHTYNQKKRTFSIEGAFGNPKVRAGCLIPVILNLEDKKIRNYLLVEKVTHEFKNCQHKMNLTLSGGSFSA